MKTIKIFGKSDKTSNSFSRVRSYKTAIYRTFVRRMHKDPRYCFDKNHDEPPGVEIRIAFFICYSSRCAKLSWDIIFVLSLWEM